MPGDRAETGLVSVKVPIIWEETNFDFSICKKKVVGLHKQRLLTLSRAQPSPCPHQLA